MRLGFAAAAAALLLTSCDRGGGEPAVAVEEAWVRLPASPSQPGSAYFTLEANSEGTWLVGVTSPLVRWVELHDSRTVKGVARMERRPEFEFPSRGPLRFEPGGRHAMLFGIHPSVKPGSRIPLTFAFDTAPPVTVEAEVRSLSGEPHARH